MSSTTSRDGRLTDRQFQTLMDLAMVSDPWPLDYGNEEITNLLHSEAAVRGFDGWYVAYHEFDDRPNTSVDIDVDNSDTFEELKLYPGMGIVVIDFGRKKVQYQDVPDHVQEGLRKSGDKTGFYVENIQDEYRYVVLRHG